MYYYFSDHLGSSNVIANAAGAIQNESDFYPFGGERVITSNITNHYKFTGKERDIESGNDYFGARYYASTMGRFLSPDWAPRPWAVPYADFSDPQSLNLYSYVHNNPLARADADGHCDFCSWAANKVSTYLATHPNVSNAIGAAYDKAVNSLGVKVFAGTGIKAKAGPVDVNLNATFNAQSSVDGKKDGLSLQGTVGAKVGDLGG